MDLHVCCTIPHQYGSVFLSCPILACRTYVCFSVLDFGSVGESSESVSRIFGLPRVHDKSYRIPLSVVTPDLSYKLRRVQERREDGRREGG